MQRLLYFLFPRLRHPSPPPNFQQIYYFFWRKVCSVGEKNMIYNLSTTSLNYYCDFLGDAVQKLLKCFLGIILTLINLYPLPVLACSQPLREQSKRGTVKQWKNYQYGLASSLVQLKRNVYILFLTSSCKSRYTSLQGKAYKPWLMFQSKQVRWSEITTGEAQKAQ